MTFPESTEVPLETEPCGGEPIGSEPVVRNAAVLAPFMLVALTVAVFYVLPSDPQIVAGLATLLLIVIGAGILAAATLFRRSLRSIAGRSSGWTGTSRRSCGGWKATSS
jgi:hypothetical protein